MKILENIINQKVSTITGDELFKYANQFNFDITEQHANNIANYLRSERVNIFNDIERANLIKKIAREVGPTTAREVNKLFLQFNAFR